MLLAYFAGMLYTATQEEHHKMKKIGVLLLSALATAVLFYAPTTHAACTVDKSKGQYCCGEVQTSIDFTNDGKSTLCSDQGASPITAILLWAIGIMGVGVGIAVVIGIILGGLKYAMSDGNEAQAKEGREIIVNAIIGLLLFIFLWAAANFLIPGGLFK